MCGHILNRPDLKNETWRYLHGKRNEPGLRKFLKIMFLQQKLSILNSFGKFTPELINKKGDLLKTSIKMNDFKNILVNNYLF